MRLSDDRYCFVCGEKNPQGLHLSFNRPGLSTVTTEFVPAKQWQGYAGIVHGGIIGAILDEAMIQALDDGTLAVTAEMTVRFLKPLKITETARIEASVTKKGARLIETRSVMTEKSSGAVIAEATAKLLRPAI